MLWLVGFRCAWSGLGGGGIGANLRCVGVDIVDHVPVAGGRLGAQAVDIDRSVHGPGVLIQRKVLIDDADLVSIALRDCGEEGLVEPSTVGALEVVEVDDDHGRGGRAATCWPSVGGDERAGVSGDIVFGELGDRLAVVRDKKADRVGSLSLLRKGYGDGAITGDFGGLRRADGDDREGGKLSLLAEQYLDAMRHGR